MDALEDGIDNSEDLDEEEDLEEEEEEERSVIYVSNHPKAIVLLYNDPRLRPERCQHLRCTASLGPLIRCADGCICTFSNGNRRINPGMQRKCENLTHVSENRSDPGFAHHQCILCGDWLRTEKKNTRSRDQRQQYSESITQHMTQCHWKISGISFSSAMNPDFNDIAVYVSFPQHFAEYNLIRDRSLSITRVPLTPPALRETFHRQVTRSRNWYCSIIVCLDRCYDSNAFPEGVRIGFRREFHILRDIMFHHLENHYGLLVVPIEVNLEILLTQIFELRGIMVHSAHEGQGIFLSVTGMYIPLRMETMLLRQLIKLGHIIALSDSIIFNLPIYGIQSAHSLFRTMHEGFPELSWTFPQDIVYSSEPLI